MEERMTVCNMSIEAGARAGMIAPDETTFDYLRGRAFAPQGADFDAAVARWQQLPTDPGAKYDKSLVFNAADIAPQVTWGTNPGQVAPVDGQRAQPGRLRRSEPSRRRPPAPSNTWASTAGTPLTDLKLDRVFIGSCTNARIEDLRAAAAVVQGPPRRRHVHAMVVPGSGLVKRRPRRKASTASSKRPASNGARPAAACAWR